MSFLIRIYTLFLGFISAFSISGTLPIPMIVAFLIIVFIFLNSSKKKLSLGFDPKLTLLFYLLLLTSGVSFLFQVNNIGFYSTGLNHTISYFAVVLIYYGVIKLALEEWEPRLEVLFKYISQGLILASVVIIVEFTSKNFLGIDFDKFIYRPINQSYTSTFANGTYFRARGVASEAGNMAMYIMMFIPFLFYYYNSMKKNKFKLCFYLVLVLFSLSLTFSAAALLDLIIAGGAICLILIFKKITMFRITRKSLLTMAMAIFILPIIAFLMTKVNFNFFASIYHKLTFSDASYSASDRVTRWERSIELFKENPIIGGGPGLASALYGTGSTSLYIETLVELGLIGITVLLLLFLLFLIKAYKLKGGIKYVYLFSLLVCMVHYSGISSYWYPWMWFLFAVIGYTFNRQSKMKDGPTPYKMDNQMSS